MQFGAAVECYDRAIEIREELVRGGRADLREDLATALMNKGVALGNQKQFGPAVECYDRAMEIREELVGGGCADLREDLAMTLGNKHILVEIQGDPAQALDLIRLAVGIRRELYEEDYSHQTEEFLQALEWMAQTLDSLGRAREARECRAEIERVS